MSFPQLSKRFFFTCALLVLSALGLAYQVHAASRPFFTRDLALTSTGKDVRALQVFLNEHHFFVATSGPGSSGHETGYFGPSTKTALAAFQNTYASSVLTPLGLTRGTGNFYALTRRFVNGLLDSSAHVSTSTRLLPAQPSSPPPPPTSDRTYTIGGSITGVTETIVLSNRGDLVTIRPGAVSAFTFPHAVADGQLYDVTLAQAPLHTACVLSANRTGVIHGASVSDLYVQCHQNPFALSSSGGGGGGGGGDTSSRTFTISGSTSHLTGTVVLTDGHGNTLPVSGESFTFPTTFLNGQDYSISVLTQPAGQTCSVPDGSGNINGANITSMHVACLTIPVIHTEDIIVERALLMTPIGHPMSDYVSSTSPGTLTYSTLGPTATFISGLLVITSFGTSTISVSQAASDGYAAATASLLFVARPTPTPTISHFRPATKTYGDAPFELSTSSTSDGSITYTSLDTDLVTVVGNVATIHAAGLARIRFDQAPWGAFPTTTTRIFIIDVQPAVPLLTFDDITRSYDGTDFLLSVTSTSDGSFTFSSDHPEVASISGDYATILAAGTTTITAVQDAYGNYAAATATALLTVPGTCAEGACGAYSTSCSIDTHGATCHCVAGVTGARCNIGINACASIPCGVHGICTRVSTLGGISPPLNSFSCTCDTGFYGATCSLLTPPPMPDIAFAPIIKYLGDAPFSIAVTSTSAGSISFDSSDHAVATVSGGMCTVVGIGTSTITMNQSADGDSYSPSTSSTLMTVYENYCSAHINPCLNGGICSPNADSFSCSCAPGYFGALCTDSTASCDGSEGPTCQNAGVCTPSPLGGECSCTPCFMGPYCEMFDPMCA